MTIQKITKKLTVLTMSAILAVGAVSFAGTVNSAKSSVGPSITAKAVGLNTYFPSDITLAVGQDISRNQSVSYNLEKGLDKYIKSYKTSNNNVAVYFSQGKNASGKIADEYFSIIGEKVGSSTVTITYSDGTTENINIKISAIDFTKSVITGINTSYEYTGKEIAPSITAKYNSNVLKKGTDYTVSYKNNKSVGTATVTINGIGTYAGTITKTFKITSKSLSKATVSGINSSYQYTGQNITPAVTVKELTDTKTTLKKDTDYTVNYKNNKSVGTATVTIKGKGNHKDTITKTFKITARNITKTSVSGLNSSYKYTGKAITPTVTIKNGTITLKKGTDYTVSYKNNKTIGTASVVIAGKGNYVGTVTKSFKIVPKTVTLKSVTTPSTKQLKATWTTDSDVTGYEIVYSIDKNFKSGNKTTTITKNSTSNTTIKGLTKNKTYYVKVRAYKTVNNSKIYGAYSSVKSVKVK